MTDIPWAPMVLVAWDAERVALPVFVVAGGAFLAWYAAGNWLMIRRARRLALWAKRAVDPFGGKQAVRWPTLQSFRLEVAEPRPPLRAAAISGLTESWDVPFVWLWNRWHWRRDMVLLELTLRRRPVWGLELWRPRALLAGDARRLAEREGWPEETLDEFRLACPHQDARALVHALLDALAEERRNLIRLAVRRAEPQLTLALNVPDPARLTPAEFHRLVRRLTETILHHASPGEDTSS
jgi:hypothetical protein